MSLQYCFYSIKCLFTCGTVKVKSCSLVCTLHDPVSCSKGLQFITQFFLLVLHQDLSAWFEMKQFSLARDQDIVLMNYTSSSLPMSPRPPGLALKCADNEHQDRQFLNWSWWERVLYQKQGKYVINPSDVSVPPCILFYTLGIFL